MSNYEREASIRPPIFDGTNFVYWKVKVTAYLQSLGTEVWDIIDIGYTFPSATPTNPAEKKQFETNAKADNTLLGCLSQSEFVKVMQYKTAKEIWDKIVLSYEGDEQVKQAKLQTLRIQYENLRMYNDESVANYFLRIYEIVNCMKNLGEEIKEVVVVEKVLRSLSPKFESKVSAIKEKENLQKITMSQLQKILTTYEMRKGGPSDRREVAFKASGKGDYYESGHMSEEEEESNFVKNIQWGAGIFKDDDFMDAIDEEGLYEEIPKLKICLKEKNMIIDTLQFQLAEREKHHEKLECEILSPLIKTGLGYNEETSQAQKASTSKSYLDAARRSKQRPNGDHQVNQGHFSSRMNRYHQVNQGKSTSNRSYNRPQEQVSADNSEGASLKHQNMENERTTTRKMGIALYAEGQENQWYINSGCLKHMTGDKEKLLSYSALEKEKKVSFGNDTPALIKGKGSVLLKEKVKVGNVMYVDGLKHNLLSVSQMCNQGTEVIFRSNGCSVRDLDTREIVIKGIRTPNNLYIFKEGQQQCYRSKKDEHWLWHQRLGHLSFSQIRKACKYQAVRGLPNIKILDNTICKSCQFGKKTRTNFPEKEGSASKPLELVHTNVCGPSRKRLPRGE
eukprot:PITA_28884